MSKVSMSTKVSASADAVWDLVGRFNGLPDWHPGVEKSELEHEGAVRRLGLVGGGTIIERLERIDDNERVYSYTIEDSPLPIKGYRSVIRVRDDGEGGAEIDWSSEFSPAGVPEGDAAAAVEGIYRAGLDNLKKMFGG